MISFKVAMFLLIVAVVGLALTHWQSKQSDATEEDSGVAGDGQKDKPVDTEQH